MVIFEGFHSTFTAQHWPLLERLVYYTAWFVSVKVSILESFG